MSCVPVYADEIEEEDDDDDVSIFSTLSPDIDDPTTAFLMIDDIKPPVVQNGRILNPGNVHANDVISFAKLYLGRPYRSGAKGPNAFDCSGFTSFVYRNFDIALSPSSSMQFTQGIAVSKDEIEPGDLLFWKGRNSGAARIGHVGMAVSRDPITGVVTFIHASSSGGIQFNKTSEPYYSARYAGARRVL